MELLQSLSGVVFEQNNHVRISEQHFHVYPLKFVLQYVVDFQYIFPHNILQHQRLLSLLQLHGRNYLEHPPCDKRHAFHDRHHQVQL